VQHPGSFVDGVRCLEERERIKQRRTAERDRGKKAPAKYVHYSNPV